ncbi:carboxymuconolactone decarboxylase family protein [Sorangium sp. So ce136]|uniref:carboxymuconolactone decarboxylase family protein n=1 Tax=Sorangium sp. So ce136 TaxID=3133284 RepID=UPI003F06CF12
MGHLQKLGSRGRRGRARRLAAAALAVAGAALAGCAAPGPAHPAAPAAAAPAAAAPAAAAPAAAAPAAAAPVAVAPAPAEAGDRFARGKAVLGRLDPAAPQRVMDGYAGLAPDFGRYVIEYPFGDIYARPGLDLRTRLLTAVAALAAVGDSEVPLGNHIRYALNVGCTRDEIVETIMQTSVYAGFPRAVKGLAVAEKVLAEQGGGK